MQDHHAKWELVIDDVLKCDIRDFCNDDKYFIFEDTISASVYSFFRDPYVQGHCRVQPVKPLIAYNDKEIPVGHMPPAGVLPSALFSRYVGPLVYISEKVFNCIL